MVLETYSNSFGVASIFTLNGSNFQMMSLKTIIDIPPQSSYQGQSHIYKKGSFLKSKYIIVIG